MLDINNNSGQPAEGTELHCISDDKFFLVSDFDKFYFDELRFCLDYFIDLLVERTVK